MTLSSEDRLESLLNKLFIGAVRDGNYHTVGVLLTEGIDISGGLAFREAAAYGHAEILRLFLYASPRGLRPYLESALCAAAPGGHTDAVRVLLEAGADASVHQHGPLRYAEENGHTETARALRDAGSYRTDKPEENPVTRLRAALRVRFTPR